MISNNFHKLGDNHNNIGYKGIKYTSPDRPKEPRYSRFHVSENRTTPKKKDTDEIKKQKSYTFKSSFS